MCECGRLAGGMSIAGGQVPDAGAPDAEPPAGGGDTDACVVVDEAGSGDAFQEAGPFVPQERFCGKARRQAGEFREVTFEQA